MQSIGWGIVNRLKSKDLSNVNAYADVIFAKLQFRTSFSSKRNNPFAEAFLCPLRSQAYLDQASEKGTASDLYRKAQSFANNMILEYEKSGIPKKYKGITNFFYPHSEFFGELRPKWAPKKKASKNKGYMNILKVSERPCVEAYRLK